MKGVDGISSGGCPMARTLEEYRVLRIVRLEVLSEYHINTKKIGNTIELYLLPGYSSLRALI